MFGEQRRPFGWTEAGRTVPVEGEAGRESESR